MTTVNTNLLPASAGLALGSATQPWAAQLQNVAAKNVAITGTFTYPGPGLVAMTFSATPVFDGSLGNTFEMTLSSNVTSSSFSNFDARFRYVFILKQDVTGGRTFVWPIGFSGAMVIDPTARITNVQEFVYDGTTLYAVSAGVSM